LTRVARALAELDRDNVIQDTLIRERAVMLGEVFAGGITSWYAGMPRFTQREFLDSVARPWFDRGLTEKLDKLAAAIKIADQPWPARVDAVERIYPRERLPQGFFFWFSGVANDISNVVDGLAQTRCARAVVAVELYRRTHDEHLPARLDDLVPGYIDSVPIDPFSGQPVRFVTQQLGYVIYSVGPNRRDDGGLVMLEDMKSKARLLKVDPLSLEDIGIRVR
jgi:hypothetical protein